jgi:hypothetical protein
METKKGVIEAMSADCKRCQIDNEWYSVYTLSSMGGAKVGDEVKFAYIEKESGGKIYNNIRGSVTVLVSGSAVAGVAPTPRATSGKSFGGESPERNMSIIRQNALTNAVNFYNARQSHTASAEFEGVDDAITSVITVAEMFALFSSGEYAEKKKALEAAQEAAAELLLARASRAVVSTGH